MASEIIMPKAGMAMEEGIIVKWLKKEGDKVEKGEPMLEILTDKVNMEVEAEESGVLLKIIAIEGEILPVLTTIGYIGEEGEEIPGILNQKVDNKKETKENVADDKKIQDKLVEYVATSKVRATPAARRVAREKGINLLSVEGSGPKGRVQIFDVESYKDNKQNATPLAAKIAESEGIDISEVQGSGYNGKVKKQDIVGLINKENSIEKIDDDSKTKIIPLTGMRKIVGQRMSESFFSAPTFTLQTEVDMTKVKELRATVKDTIMNETGEKITITDIIIMATSKALMKYPMVNASLVENGIELHNYVNMALAIGLEEGLLVPVIKDVERKRLSDIVVATKDVINRTKSKKINPNELKGSTFTISNLGMFGITHFNPIINQPNSAILGVNTIQDRIIPVDGEPVVKPIMTLSLTIDHRVIDGAPGANFLQYLKQLLENPIQLLV